MEKLMQVLEWTISERDTLQGIYNRLGEVSEGDALYDYVQSLKARIATYNLDIEWMKKEIEIQ